jgi:ATP-dependent Zn protease
MSKKQQQNDNNNINNNDNNNNFFNNNFFNNNPILIFVIFAIVTIFAFKTIFSDETMGVSNSNVQAFGQSSNKTIAYSDLKKLISAGKIEYVGIGNTQIRAISKSEGGQVITYTARRVIPDETLITELEKNNIGYGGINEENILADILFGWVLPIFIFFAIWIQNLAEVLPKYQDKDGLWYQVLDQPMREGNFPEASVTTQFMYAYAKAVNKGYVDKKYKVYAEKAFKGLKEKLLVENADGTLTLTRCCQVGGLGGNPYRDGSFEYYIGEKMRDNDAKATGPFIMGCLELAK